MKKVKKVKKIAFNSQKEILAPGLLTFFSCLILSALAYWKISPSTFREFDTTCQHFAYNDCMRWFYTTQPYYQTILIVALIFALLTLIVTLFLFFRKKK